MRMITCDNCDKNGIWVTKFLSNKTAAGFQEWYEWPVEKGLEHLVYLVSGKPNFLEAHVERIYYCFQNRLDEPLFGALVDLMTILRGKGLALSKRMVLASKSRLTEKQLSLLLNHLGKKDADVVFLPGSRFSVFTRGLLSAATLLQHHEDSSEKIQDPLTLAKDYIEFSQLDSAVHILEQAILSQPERMALHYELLSLYRSTRNLTGFNLMYETLAGKEITLPIEWRQLCDFFMQLSSDEQ